jgi:ribonuclease HII
MSLLPYHKRGRLEAGCDEAGRGCLAGPVVAAAVILPEDIEIPDLNDSKKLSEKVRERLRPIVEKEAIAYAVSFVWPEKIDEVNILNASFLAMSEAVEQLELKPEHLLIDGNRFKSQLDIPFDCMIKGDGRFLSIAAASILAKTYRDEYMDKIHKEHPYYGWNSNKGYPTKAHRDGIRDHGISPYHRKSFTLLPEQLSLF